MLRFSGDRQSLRRGGGKRQRILLHPGGFPGTAGRDLHPHRAGGKCRYAAAGQPGAAPGGYPHRGAAEQDGI